MILVVSVTPVGWAGRSLSGWMGYRGCVRGLFTLVFLAFAVYYFGYELFSY